MEILTGLWTMYIHTDLFPLPWPLMGCDYHYIHHRYNWCTRTPGDLEARPAQTRLRACARTPEGREGTGSRAGQRRCLPGRRRRQGWPGR